MQSYIQHYLQKVQIAVQQLQLKGCLSFWQTSSTVCSCRSTHCCNSRCSLASTRPSILSPRDCSIGTTDQGLIQLVQLNYMVSNPEILIVDDYFVRYLALPGATFYLSHGKVPDWLKNFCARKFLTCSHDFTTREVAFSGPLGILKEFPFCLQLTARSSWPSSAWY